MRDAGGWYDLSGPLIENMKEAPLVYIASFFILCWIATWLWQYVVGRFICRAFMFVFCSVPFTGLIWGFITTYFKIK